MRLQHLLFSLLPVFVMSGYAQTTPSSGTAARTTTTTPSSSGAAPPTTTTTAPAGTAAPTNTTQTPSAEPGIAGRFAPGSSLTVPAPKNATPTVTIVPIDNSQKSFEITGKQDEHGITLTLPATIETGNYYFKISTGNVPGSIDVEQDNVSLSSVHPTTAYGAGEKNAFDFILMGSNFSTNPDNDHVLVDDGDIVESRGQSADDCTRKKGCCLWAKDSHQLQVMNFKPAPHEGIAKVAVRVGEGKPSGTQQIVFARVSGAFVFLASAAATALLFWIVTTIVRSGLANKSVGVKKLQLWQIFVFDPETNSYSLSKFQLLLFSITFIFGYLYVLLSTWLVQWQFLLPDVPNTMSGLLGISAGTTIAAAGLSAARGAKGAGLQTPTGADLISSGGVVIPERFQFFVWTIVACAGFIVLLVGQDPATVNKFPDIPSGLLYVMGVSAAGYLGGKAARKPGPVLELIGIESKTSSAARFVLTVQGHNLDAKGRFFVDDQELGILTEQEKKDLGVKPDQNLTETTPEVGAADTNFCNQLKITIPASKMDLSRGSHTFRIVNRDGQFADLRFKANAPVIKAVYELKDPPQEVAGDVKPLPASQKVNAVILGTNLPLDATVSWQRQNDQDFTDLDKPQNTDTAGGTKLIVAIKDTGPAGTGVLKLTTSTGDVVTVEVKVAGTTDSGTSKPAVSAAQQDTSTQQTTSDTAQGNAAPNRPGTGAEPAGS
ncbi:MAG: hypothetical protein JO051_17005 [Acidobacteriaceae bacterium]|nr:hypothetical protein [Acidobacteriaceae bacterium]